MALLLPGLPAGPGDEAPDVMTQITQLDPFEVQRSERLRFRTTLCEAWVQRRKQRIFLTEMTSVDHSVKWLVRLEPAADGMLATVTTDDAEQGNTYDVLELVRPGGGQAAPSPATTCDGVTEGRFMTKLSWRKTGRTVSW
jgi:hypothetical protein